jgi:hypothetical protein
MGFYTTDSVLDRNLLFLQTNVTDMTLCSSQPANFQEAYDSSESVVLARTSSVVSLTSADFSIGDSTRATGGRALATSAINGLTIVTASSCTHCAMVSVTSSALLHVVKTGLVSLTTGGLANIAAFKVESADPTSGTLA